MSSASVPTLTTQIANLAEQADKLARDLQEAIDAAKATSTPVELAGYYVQIQDLNERLEEPRKRVTALRDHMKMTALPAIFEDHDLTSIKTTPNTKGEVFTVSIQTLVRASIADKSGGFAWLRDHDYGDLITEGVHAGTLASFAKEYLAKEGRDLPSEFFKVHVGSTTSVRRSKAAS